MEEKENLTNTYELTLLLSSELSEIDLAKAIDRIKKSITAHSGEIIKNYSWGKKRLAYHIGSHEFGHYHTIIFTIPKANTNEIIKELELASDVLRHLNLSLDKEGIEVNDLFTPEKEASMIAASMKEKMENKAGKPRKTKPAKETETIKTKTEEEKPEPEKEISPEEEKKRLKKERESRLEKERELKTATYYQDE